MSLVALTVCVLDSGLVYSRWQRRFMSHNVFFFGSCRRECAEVKAECFVLAIWLFRHRFCHVIALRRAYLCRPQWFYSQLTGFAAVQRSGEQHRSRGFPQPLNYTRTADQRWQAHRLITREGPLWAPTQIGTTHNLNPAYHRPLITEWAGLWVMSE